MAKWTTQERYNLLRELLIDARKKAGLLQKDVGKRLKNTQSFVSKIERGERKLNPIEFMDICYILEIDPCDLLKQLPSKYRGTQSKNKR